jgi:hypothetical protein
MIDVLTCQLPTGVAIIIGLSRAQEMWKEHQAGRLLIDGKLAMKTEVLLLDRSFASLNTTFKVLRYHPSFSFLVIASLV